MRKWRVSNVVQQRCETHQLQIPLKTRRLVIEIIFKNLRRPCADGVIHQSRSVHHSERMLEPRVHGTRINLVCPSQLPNSSQPLKSGTRNDLFLPRVQSHEAVNGATDLVRLVGVTHLEKINLDEEKEKVHEKLYCHFRCGDQVGNFALIGNNLLDSSVRM